MILVMNIVILIIICSSSGRSAVAMGRYNLSSSLYIYVCVCIYIYIYTYICIHIHTHTYTCLSIHEHIILWSFFQSVALLSMALSIRRVSCTRHDAPNLPAKIVPAKVAWLNPSGEFPVDVRIPSLRVKLPLESDPHKSIILVRRDWWFRV